MNLALLLPPPSGEDGDQTPTGLGLAGNENRRLASDEVVRRLEGYQVQGMDDRISPASDDDGLANGRASILIYNLSRSVISRGYYFFYRD